MDKRQAGKLGYLKSKDALDRRNAKFLERYYAEPKKCKTCEKIIEYKKRRNDYCCHSCAASQTNVERGRASRKSEKHTCLQCGKDSHTRKYCSITCHNEYKNTTFITKWLAGEIDPGTCDGMHVSVIVKRWLKKERGDKCEICGWHEVHPVTNRVPLQLDHMDGNSLNNGPENLRLLCPNCHSLTPTFGNLNRGKGRKKRYDQQKKRGVADGGRVGGGEGGPLPGVCRQVRGAPGVGATGSRTDPDLLQRGGQAFRPVQRPQEVTFWG